MNHLSKRNRTQKINTLFIVIAFMFLSNCTVFAQTTPENTIESVIEKSEIVNTNMEVNAIKQQAATSVDSNTNFILWFMGSKQAPNRSFVPGNASEKKQFMTSGTEPNRLLIKAFLKKAINFENATA